MMYATLAQFLRMSPEDQRRVTHLDLSIADESDNWRGKNPFVTPEESALEYEERTRIYRKGSL